MSYPMSGNGMVVLLNVIISQLDYSIFMKHLAQSVSINGHRVCKLITEIE